MNTVDRVTRIVSYLAEKAKPVSIAELSHHLQLNKSGIYRILSFLEASGWVVQQPDTEMYYLGNGIVELSVSILSKYNLRSASQPFMEELSKTTNQTIILNLRTNLDRIVIDQVVPSQDMLYLVPFGRRLPLWLGSHGKAIMAFLSEAEIKAILDDYVESGRPGYASGKKTSADEIRKQLEKVRERGYATSAGEVVAETIGVAAPIFGRGHQAVGSLAIAALTSKISLDAIDGYGQLLKRLAHEISIRLGDFDKPDTL